MSVINQMLKELDQRNAGQGQSTSVPVAVTKKTSATKIMLISLVVILVLNAVGLYIWQLVSENQSLKLQTQMQLETETQFNKRLKQLKREKQQQTQQKAQQKIVAVKTLTPVIIESQSKLKPPGTQPAIAIKQVNHVAITKAVKAKPMKAEPAKAKPLKEVVDQEFKPKSKMIVSRRHLTEDELVAKKVAKAELALNREQIGKAEQLFEDVLIIQPSNDKVRQKLAALWFGRKAYQQAGNLLSQGIAIDAKNSDLRVMKAKIALKQNNYQAAYRSLKPLAKLQQQDYQLLLANTAQQANQVNGAINAYKELINMQPDSAKWPLGLAIVYDKNSQFQLATEQYKQALNKNDLSASSSSFAQQRIQALKE